MSQSTDTNPSSQHVNNNNSDNDNNNNNKSNNKKHTIYINFKQCISIIKNMRSNYIVMLYKDAVKTWKK